MFGGISPNDVEFGQKCLVLVKARNPLLSVEAKHKILRDFVDSLSQQTFVVYSGKILDMVDFSKKNAQNYKTTQEHVQYVISWCPRFADIKNDLTERVRKARQKYLLP